MWNKRTACATSQLKMNLYKLTKTTMTKKKEIMTTTITITITTMAITTKLTTTCFPNYGTVSTFLESLAFCAAVVFIELRHCIGMKQATCFCCWQTQALSGLKLSSCVLLQSRTRIKYLNISRHNLYFMERVQYVLSQANYLLTEKTSSVADIKSALLRLNKTQ